ncbi:MAG TPA: sigma-54 dependent transcriptional regulator [Acidobacteriaceae bacterium]|jgi:two-component system nitrogen regulation response regulator NtrX|nr:sigma-54 dependent transcriptional regulator [Acidobacteriaceae bacterium]
MNHILIVDDEVEIRETLEEILREEGYAVASAATAAEALTQARDPVYDLLLLDVWLPDRDGLEVLAELRALDADTRPEVIVISGHATIETAVKATKLGAFDFLEKPLMLERTLIVVKNAIEAKRLRADNLEFRRQLTVEQQITGESVQARALRQQIRLMAPTNGRVLIYGESGSGKELIARAIHAESLRCDRVFVELNCAAIPEDFIESELFGYRNGAVPGGPPEKRGTFERANGGTLFLDEAGDMSLKMQGKVLRALDEQRFLPVGALQPISVDVRVIAATNKNLEDEIAKGNFREDFFYRLNVIPFFVPPLRDRREDIPLLVREFLRGFGREYGRPRVEMADDAIELLRHYHWPGNVRELKNVIERVLILNPQAHRIERRHLPMLVHRTAVRTGDFDTLQQARDAYEREYILRKIDDCNGNMSRAAETLGLERSHLYRKMKALGISVREPAQER